MHDIYCPDCRTIIESQLIDEHENNRNAQKNYEFLICANCKCSLKISLQANVNTSEITLSVEKGELLENPFVYTYKLALRDNPNCPVPYDNLLLTLEWINYRENIISRDNGICRKCHVIPNSHNGRHLQVHHTFYVNGLLPWQYNVQDLITLCDFCHSEFHKNNKVHVYRSVNHKLELMNSENCERCDGAGYISQYRKVSNGICFQCRGKGYIILSENP